ncbi:MAG: hypothetical protein C4518_16950 [Desulfobacteraceae bacterium]|nr:MAG: hypothetical protein C4518_16950 [Desulfobacteraceae bacterium]
MLYEDIQSGRKQLLEEIYSFLGVTSWFGNEITSRSNQTKTPRIESVNQFISGAREILQPKKFRWLKTGIRKSGAAAIAELIRDRINVKPMENRPALSETTRTHWADYFKEDIKQLEQLIQRDLSIWK